MGNSIEVHGDGSQIRSWCYIEDFCDAIIEMLARPAAIGEDFNIGNAQNTLTVLQLAREILKVTGQAVPIELIDSPFPDIEIRVPSLGKARHILDYRPTYGLRKSLELTVDWYREHLDFFEEKISSTAAGSAAQLANLSAGIKVGKRGTACVSLEEIRASLNAVRIPPDSV